MARKLILSISASFFLTVSPLFAREAVYYYHNDHLGTPQMMTDQTGTKVWEAEYLPFGEATVNEDPDGNGFQVVNNLRFPGQYYDAETGLHYNWHRYYDPRTGRYLEADPVGIVEDSYNLYAYANNNAISVFDQNGLSFTIFIRSEESLTLIGCDGQVIAQYKASNKTDHPDADPNLMGGHGPAPLGGWAVTGPYKRSGSDLEKFGPYSWNIGVGSDIPNLRDLRIHGGTDTYVGLTWGCIRMSNIDILDMVEKTKDDPINLILIKETSP